MRLLILPAFVVFLAGCSLFGEDRVREGIFGAVSVEALPLDRPWDRGAPNTDPDVYVSVWDDEERFPGGPSLRTAVAEDVRRASLPLTLTTTARRAIPIDHRVRLVVYDRDGGTFLDDDDEMFRLDTLRLASLLRPEDRPGTGRTLVFENAETRLLVRVEWR